MFKAESAEEPLEEAPLPEAELVESAE